MASCLCQIKEDALGPELVQQMGDMTPPEAVGRCLLGDMCDGYTFIESINRLDVARGTKKVLIRNLAA